MIRTLSRQQPSSTHLALVASRAERFRPTSDNLNTVSLVDEVDTAVVTTLVDVTCSSDLQSE